MMERVEWGSYESEKKKLRNIECKRLNDKGSPLTSNEKIYHKEYCLSDENRKVTGRVRINNIQNLNAENLNLPLEDPLANARESLEAAAVLLKQLNDILDDSYKSKYIFEQQLYLKEREETLEKLITDIRDYTESVEKELRHWDTDDAKMLLATAEEMEVAVNTIFKEIDARLEYSLEGARANIKLAMEDLKQNTYKNITPAVHLMKQGQNPKVQNIALLGNYSEALQAYYRKQRESRVRRASRGGQTRRKHH
jgi:Na+/phosphate symporter